MRKKSSRSIEGEYRRLAADSMLKTLQAIPLSAVLGENVLHQGSAMPWYQGPTLLQYLDTVEVQEPGEANSFRMPVQWVNRPHLDYRGFCGRIASGSIRPGDPSGFCPPEGPPW